LYPDCDGKIPRIGVFNSAVPELNKKDYLVYSGSSAISAMKPEYLGARIVEIDGEKIENFSQIDRILSDKADKTLQVTLAYVPPIDGSRQAEPPKLESVALPTQPVRTIGLVMEMGEIVAIQDGSPAQAAGLKAGDRIVEFDGKPIAACDPMRLPDLVRRRGEEPITLGIEREKGKPAEKIELKPRRIEWVNSNKDDKAPVAISQLGIAYSVSNRVDHIERNSPAAKAGIAKGAEVEWIKLTPPKGKTMKPFVAEQKAITCDLPKDVRWPAVFDCLQMVDPDSTVELKLNDRKETISMGLADVEGWYNTDRGLIFEGRKYIEQAAGFKEACRLGATETWDSMTMVVRFMRGMGSGRISATNVGGPFSIFWAAYYAAERGFGSLLIFLTMLSANLAVLNVLPIPMLDGGHLVFLGYEGVRGKPANERVQIVLSIIGFVMILALMIFACGLDIQRFLFR
jgi:regulator of sigma E protease